MHQKTMLVMHIEDNLDHADLVAAAIKQNRQPCRLLSFKDAESALAFLTKSRRGDDKSRRIPDLILLDINLPGMTGLDFLREVRTDERTRGIPIVILSTFARADDVTRAYRFGASSYIIKPARLAGRDEYVLVGDGGSSLRDRDAGDCLGSRLKSRKPTIIECGEVCFTCLASAR